MQRTQIGGAESSMESMSMGDYLSTVTALGEQWRAPALESLLPDLSRDERLRLQAALRHRQRAYKGSPPPRPLLSERERDSYILIHAHYAIQYYNASHPGDEFHVVKPLMVSSSGRLSTGDAWFHVNFWARSRSSSKIKRFFAEVHNKPSTSEFIKIGPMQIPAPIPVVEVCTILKSLFASTRLHVPCVQVIATFCTQRVA
ncbi:hypothetical protein ACP4OV_001858 [Aristida adscensionis]